jgi:hypothetical protein
MPEGSIDPGSLEGDALTRWYLRSPAEIDEERQAAAAKRYQDFFYAPSGPDPDSGFARQTSSPDREVDPDIAVSLSSQEVDPGFTWMQVGPNRFRSVKNTPDDGSSRGSTSYGDPPPTSQANVIGQYPQVGESDVSASEPDLTPQPTVQPIGELIGPPTAAFNPMPTSGSSRGSVSTVIPPVRSFAAPARAQIAKVAVPANTPSGQGRMNATVAKARSSVGHPGFAESLIPVWGSGREAVADFQEGNYAGAALNGALAASDLFLAESIAKGLAKGGFYVAKNVARKAPHDWDKVVRPWMGKQGFLEPLQHGHHWAIPQNGWGKQIPDAIKNQPWNIKPMPSAEVHGRIAGSYKGKPQFSVAERYWYGTPAWSKVGTAVAIGHPLAAANAQSGQRK